MMTLTAPSQQRERGRVRGIIPLFACLLATVSVFAATEYFLVRDDSLAAMVPADTVMYAHGRPSDPPFSSTFPTEAGSAAEAAVFLNAAGEPTRILRWRVSLRAQSRRSLESQGWTIKDDRTAFSGDAAAMWLAENGETIAEVSDVSRPLGVLRRSFPVQGFILTETLGDRVPDTPLRNGSKGQIAVSGSNYAPSRLVFGQTERNGRTLSVLSAPEGFSYPASGISWLGNGGPRLLQHEDAFLEIAAPGSRPTQPGSLDSSRDGSRQTGAGFGPGTAALLTLALSPTIDATYRLTTPEFISAADRLASIRFSAIRLMLFGNKDALSFMLEVTTKDVKGLRHALVDAIGVAVPTMRQFALPDQGSATESTVQEMPKDGDLAFKMNEGHSIFLNTFQNKVIVSDRPNLDLRYSAQKLEKGPCDRFNGKGKMFIDMEKAGLSQHLPDLLRSVFKAEAYLMTEAVDNKVLICG